MTGPPGVHVRTWSWGQPSRISQLGPLKSYISSDTHPTMYFHLAGIALRSIAFGPGAGRKLTYMESRILSSGQPSRISQLGVTRPLKSHISADTHPTMYFRPAGIALRSIASGPGAGRKLTYMESRILSSGQPSRVSQLRVTRPLKSYPSSDTHPTMYFHLAGIALRSIAFGPGAGRKLTYMESRILSSGQSSSDCLLMIKF
ncbi:hypothetical protein DFP72DRAFT_1059890 [Ephemerocybe angulata]|uniref:Uncharacterized protein n=1 Tax=Ephemerocybe angulata TaxID=980116 RepID=A0A8H6IE26_9AGAR|nr:hypothetical protein DFP72DRAFT_1059890 [Tulosesus angulatus]